LRVKRVKAMRLITTHTMNENAPPDTFRERERGRGRAEEGVVETKRGRACAHAKE